MIRASEHAVVYACSWWLDIVSPGWEALILDDYSTGMPLTQRKKFGISYLYQPAFTQQLGIFGKTNNAEAFLKAIPKKFRLVEIQLNYLNRPGTSENISLTNKLTHHLPLDRNIEEIRSRYSENTRRNIKKFERTELKIQQEKNIEDLIQIFRSNKGARIETLKEEEYDVLRKLIDASTSRDACTILKVKNNNEEVIAGAAFIHSFSSYIFIFSATDQQARETGAMAAIIDHFIERHAGEQKFLDFEGSMNPDLARFYKSFGSQEIVYLQIRRNTLPPIIRRLK